MEPFTIQEKENIFNGFKKATETDDPELFFKIMKGIIAGYLAKAY